MPFNCTVDIDAISKSQLWPLNFSILFYIYKTKQINLYMEGYCIVVLMCPIKRFFEEEKKDFEEEKWHMARERERERESTVQWRRFLSVKKELELEE